MDLSHAESSLLSPVDAAWLSMESPANPMTITVLLRVEGLTASVFKRFLENHWLSISRFRAMPVRRGTIWRWEEDPVFRVRHHLKVSSDAPDEEQLQQWISQRLNQPLPDYRPRWCFWLLPNAEGGAALLLRMHHCYADGLSLVGVFNALTTGAPDALPAGCPASADTRAAARWLEAGWQWFQSQASQMAAEGQAGVAGSHRQLEKMAMSALRVAHGIGDYLLEPEDTPSRLKPGLLGRRVCRWSSPLPLSRFRSVADATGCKINDVLLACVTLALRRQLKIDQDDLDDVTLHAAVPVDIRGLLPDQLQPAPGEVANLFGTVFVPLPVDGNSPLERLFRVKHETRRLKKSVQPGVSWGLMCAAGLLPVNVQQPIADLFCRKASAVVSNVPGSRDVRYLAGCRVKEQMFWVPQSGDIGLGVSIVSYAGQVQFGVVADEAVLPEPQAFLNDCLMALNDYS